VADFIDKLDKSIASHVRALGDVAPSGPVDFGQLLAAPQAGSARNWGDILGQQRTGQGWGSMLAQQAGQGAGWMQGLQQSAQGGTNWSSLLAGGGGNKLFDLSGFDLFNSERQQRLFKEAQQAEQESKNVLNEKGTGTGATGADPATDKWRSLIDEAASQFGIDGDAIQAVMMIESSGNPGARSSAGAMGLMQVMPFHFKAGEDGMDPRTNVMKGAGILADNYKRYGSWDKAVAAYLGAIDANGNITGAQDANGTDGFEYANLFNTYYQRIKAARTAKQQAPVGASGGAFPVVGYQGQVQLHHGSHQGAADIFAQAGTGVAAIRGGQVTSAGWSDLGGWNVSIYDPETGLTFYYAHLQNAPSVKAGQTVGAGTVFGQVGDTGNAKGTGAHLHIGIGYGIQSGAGPGGGAGINFNATQYLQQLLGVTAGGDGGHRH
jgi:murein DD-endopeptidase MepM/ murein hydrolase activator NlpD